MLKERRPSIYIPTASDQKQDHNAEVTTTLLAQNDISLFKFQKQHFHALPAYTHAFYILSSCWKNSIPLPPPRLNLLPRIYSLAGKRTGMLIPPDTSCYICPDLDGDISLSHLIASQHKAKGCPHEIRS